MEVMCLLLALYFYFFLAPHCVTLYFILLIVSGLFFYLFLRCCIVLFFETLFSVSFLLSPFYVVVFSLLFFPDFSPSFEIIRPSKPSSRGYPKYLRSFFFFFGQIDVTMKTLVGYNLEYVSAWENLQIRVF